MSCLGYIKICKGLITLHGRGFVPKGFFEMAKNIKDGIKMKFLKRFFREELEYENENYRARCAILEKELKSKIHITEECYKLIQRIFSIELNITIVGFEKNKNGEDLIVCMKKNGNDFLVKLYGRSYKAINGNPRIIATIHEFPEQQNNAYYIHIDDITAIDYSVGNGTILMTYFLKMVERLKNNYSMNIVHINGCLSSFDKSRFDIIEDYYSKFGFDVTFNKDRSSGSIMMLL